MAIVVYPHIDVTPEGVPYIAGTQTRCLVPGCDGMD
jgi:hypothetical protein